MEAKGEPRKLLDLTWDRYHKYLVSFICMCLLQAIHDLVRHEDPPRYRGKEGPTAVYYYIPTCGKQELKESTGWTAKRLLYICTAPSRMMSWLKCS